MSRKIFVDGKDRTLGEFEDENGNITIKGNSVMRAENIEASGDIVMVVGGENTYDASNDASNEAPSRGCVIQ